MMREAPRNKFDVVMVEALDRFSRDHEDTAGLFKRLTFAGVLHLVTMVATQRKVRARAHAFCRSGPGPNTSERRSLRQTEQVAVLASEIAGRGGSR
jgi:hypothetical protein